MDNQGFEHGASAFRVVLSDTSRLAIISLAAERGMSPDEWLCALVEAQIGRKPRWSSAELQSMRDANSALQQLVYLASEGEIGSRQDMLDVISTAASGLEYRVERMEQANHHYWTGSRGVAVMADAA